MESCYNESAQSTVVANDTQKDADDRVPKNGEGTKRVMVGDEEVATAYFEFCAEVGERMEGRICLLENPKEFWFRPASLDEFLLDLDQCLHHYYEEPAAAARWPSLSSCQLMAVGMPCAVKFFGDGRWHRARVADFGGLVRFVDSGQTQFCLPEQVKPLARQFSEFMHPAAVRCRIVNFQQPPTTPGFLHESQRVAVIVRSKVEPYQVSVECLNRSSDSGGRASARTNAQTVAHGYKPQPRTGIPMFIGRIVKVYATGGHIRSDRYPNKDFQFDVERTYLNRGLFSVQDASRVLRVNDGVVGYAYDLARYERSYGRPGGGGQEAAADSLVVNNMRLTDVSVLVCHATVTYVCKGSTSLYCRYTKDTIFAPACTFPDPPGLAQEHSDQVDLRTQVTLGRSVVVRAERSSNVPHFAVNAPWIATAVEYLGDEVEGWGTMYFVRDEYSVIITDHKDCDYVFAANQCVNAEDVPMKDWYGMHVYFRACPDIPDIGAWSFHMKALRVDLLPNKPRGSYYCKGIYRPPISRPHTPDQAVSALNRPGRRASTAINGHSGGQPCSMLLSEENLTEIRLLGMDQLNLSDLESDTGKSSDASSVDSSAMEIKGGETTVLPAPALALTDSNDYGPPLINGNCSSSQWEGPGFNRKKASCEVTDVESTPAVMGWILKENEPQIVKEDPSSSRGKEHGFELNEKKKKEETCEYRVCSGPTSASTVSDASTKEEISQIPNIDYSSSSRGHEPGVEKKKSSYEDMVRTGPTPEISGMIPKDNAPQVPKEASSFSGAEEPNVEKMREKISPGKSLLIPAVFSMTLEENATQAPCQKLSSPLFHLKEPDLRKSVEDKGWPGSISLPAVPLVAAVQNRHDSPCRDTPSASLSDIEEFAVSENTSEELSCAESNSIPPIAGITRKVNELQMTNKDTSPFSCSPLGGSCVLGSNSEEVKRTDPTFAQANLKKNDGDSPSSSDSGAQNRQDSLNQNQNQMSTVFADSSGHFEASDMLLVPSPTTMIAIETSLQKITNTEQKSPPAVVQSDISLLDPFSMLDNSNHRNFPRVLRDPTSHPAPSPRQTAGICADTESDLLIDLNDLESPPAPMEVRRVRTVAIQTDRWTLNVEKNEMAVFCVLDISRELRERMCFWITGVEPLVEAVGHLHDRGCEVGCQTEPSLNRSLAIAELNDLMRNDYLFDRLLRLNRTSTYEEQRKVNLLLKETLRQGG